MRAAVAGVAALFFTVSSAHCASRIWTTAEDFKGGITYGATVSSYSDSDDSADAEITLVPQVYYGAKEDDTYTTVWTGVSQNPNLVNLNYSVQENSAVICGDFIYSIAGCQAESGGCDTSGGGMQTVASVYFKRIIRAGATEYMEAGEWTKAAYEFGQTAGSLKGIPTRQHVALAVGNRIYVFGGATTNCLGDSLPTAQKAVTSVYSTLVNPVTGQTGPWERENSLPLAVVEHTAVYSNGVFFVMGGVNYLPNNLALPRQDVQRAEIRPDGHLGEWDLKSEKIPPGVAPDNIKLCDDGLCLPCVTACSPCTNDCCRQLNVCMGWLRFDAFSVMRTIGFFGGAYMESYIAVNEATYSRNAHYAYVDDCNRPVSWTRIDGDKAVPGTGTFVVAGAVVSAGGNHPSGSALRQVIYSYHEQSGIQRDLDSRDQSELRPLSPTSMGKTLATDTEKQLINPTYDMPAVVDGNYLYIIGGYSQQFPCKNVYRARLATTSFYVDAGNYVSPPYDIYSPGEPSMEYKLTKVSWSFTKTGDDAVLGLGKRDDWAGFRYRVASADGTWTCWSPRFPETDGIPELPGAYAFSSDSAEVQSRMPVFQDSFRYIQFEVSLYNDASVLSDYPSPTLPKFTEFKIEYVPAPPRVEMVGCVRVYPNPAEDRVKVKFEAAPSGGELAVKIFNVAGEMVRKDQFRYTSGGFKEEIIDTREMAEGAYVVLVDGISGSGNEPVKCKDTMLKNATGKFVIRKKR